MPIKVAHFCTVLIGSVFIVLWSLVLLGVRFQYVFKRILKRFKRVKF